MAGKDVRLRKTTASMKARPLWIEARRALPGLALMLLGLMLLPAGVGLSQAAGNADGARGAYERAKQREADGDLEGAYHEYALVVEDYPGTEWAALAQERQLEVFERQLDDFSQEEYSPGNALVDIIYMVLRWVFLLLFISMFFGVWGYRRGWFWRSRTINRVADTIGGAYTRFQNRRKLGRELELRKANPRDAKARHSLGVVYYQSRSYQKALDELQESVSIDPDRIDAQYHLGLTLLRLNRPAEALGPLETVVSRRGNHGGDAGVRLAEARIAAGDAAGAEALCRQFMASSPTDPDCRVVLAMALDAQRRPDEVPELLTEAVQLGRAYSGVRKREALAAARRARAYMRSRAS